MAERKTRELFLGEGSSADGTQHLYVNMGPAHPAMHGIIRIFAELDGETVVKTDVEIGYLHRAFEKDCEAGPYNNAIPYTDRLNYVSPLINNFGYSSAIEKLLGIEITDRCKYIRVIMSEISRICDHLTCVGASAMELGAFTVFLYMIKAREFLWELVEDVTGARLTISYGRVGGVKADLPAGSPPTPPTKHQYVLPRTASSSSSTLNGWFRRKAQSSRRRNGFRSFTKCQSRAAKNRK